MSFTLSVREVGDVSIVDMAGRVTLSKGSSVLCDTLHDLAAKGHKKILVNLGEVSYLDKSASCSRDNQRHH